VTFKADKGTATITDANLTVVTDNAVADGAAKNRLKAVVTDANGNVVPDAAVVFTAGNGGLPVTQTVTTGADGSALFDVTNIRAGVTGVTAAVNGMSVSKDVTFKVDTGTATITDANLTVVTDNAVADGAAKNR
ncbi:Ig-like domain-containing protein, partial [Morganella morganii]|uniref:Ig-like domain-containing protein n=1 Tax=Morganella morganii TaxID=582 RepID=UPI0032DAFA23